MDVWLFAICSGGVQIIVPEPENMYKWKYQILKYKNMDLTELKPRLCLNGYLLETIISVFDFGSNI